MPRGASSWSTGGDLTADLAFACAISNHPDRVRQIDELAIVSYLRKSFTILGHLFSSWNSQPSACLPIGHMDLFVVLALMQGEFVPIPIEETPVETFARFLMMG